MVARPHVRDAGSDLLDDPRSLVAEDRPAASSGGSPARRGGRSGRRRWRPCGRASHPPAAGRARPPRRRAARRTRRGRPPALRRHRTSSAVDSAPWPCPTLERRVVDAIEATARRARRSSRPTLVGFDTTARNPDDPPRQERDAPGAPRGPAAGGGSRGRAVRAGPGRLRRASRSTCPEWVSRAGRSSSRASPARGGGRSLLFNGHIDAVSVEPIDRWTSHPFTAEVRDGNLYGRGSCDMKGGIACMVFAAEVLAGLGIRLAGDLLVATNTDEESSGAGGLGARAPRRPGRRRASSPSRRASTSGSRAAARATPRSRCRAGPGTPRSSSRTGARAARSTRSRRRRSCSTRSSGCARSGRSAPIFATRASASPTSCRR